MNEYLTSEDDEKNQLQNTRDIARVGEVILSDDASDGRTIRLEFHFSSKKINNQIHMSHDVEEDIIRLGGDHGITTFVPLIVKSYFPAERKAEQRAKIQKTLEVFTAAVLARVDNL